MKNGSFIISLDFELHWGAAEKWDLQSRKEYFETTRKSIPDVLGLFKTYGIHATWATVGFLFSRSKKQLLEFSPKEKPSYINQSLNYYNLLTNGTVGEDEADDPYHFAPSLIKEIINTPNQEMATHTFSHYYCNEPGQRGSQFDCDLKAARALAKENFDIELKSLVFPRNQFNNDYLEIAAINGISVVRSNPDVWFWRTKSQIAPLARAADTLMPISKTLTFKEGTRQNSILLLPASRFLRPYSEKERLIQDLKISRVKNEMEFAAKRKRAYHLWWHPHNFGYSLTENMKYLEDILKHYKQLENEFGFESKSMIEMY